MNNIITEISQTENDKYCMISQMESKKKKAKLTEIRDQTRDYQRQKVGEGGLGGKWSKSYKLPV